MESKRSLHLRRPMSAPRIRDQTKTEGKVLGIIYIVQNHTYIVVKSLPFPCIDNQMF